MALPRRVLPSRTTPIKASDSAATAASATLETPKRTQPAPATPADATTALPEKAPAQAQTGAVAAAATSAFSTLPAVPARVLEESFVKPASITPPEVQSPAAMAPAWEAVAKPAPATQPVTPAAPAFSAPAWEAENKAKAEEESASATAKALREAMPIPAPEEPVAPIKTPWQAPASYASQESSTPALPEATQKAPEPQAPEPQAIEPAVELPAIKLQPAPMPRQPEARPEPLPQPAPAPQPAPIALEQQPSRPDNSPHKRRVREKRPRDFSAMGAPPADPDQPASNKVMTSFAANVPVDTRPLDKVNDNLIATGIMAPKPLDSLTGSLPTGLAETTFATPPAAVELPEIKPAPRPVPAAAPANAPAPVRRPEPEPLPIIPPTPARAPQPLPVAEPAMAPIPITPTPAFNLSSSTPAPAADILPPPQSDLPWTRAQSAAEWEIEAPDTGQWQAEGEGASSSNPAAPHMPSPAADLYKPFGNASPQNSSPMSGIPPRNNTHFTPELPGQRVKSGGGTPWLLIAVIVLAAGGAGAYFLRSGGNGKVQQQLASLTSGTTRPAPEGNNALLPPPDNSPFYAPATTTSKVTVPITDASTSAVVVAFADVPADQANQPIVATGSEEVPKDLNVFDRFKTEVQRIKAGDDNGTAAATPVQPAATATGAITPDKLQEELAAYRSALAQSGDPKSLTPATFRKDPDGYMDGKPQQAQGTPTSTDANGNLLPPPAGNAGVLPPPDLYTNNPKNLPVVNEPLANAPARVRTLADFPDIEPYTPEREKVEIPKNLKPKMAATDFPALEVLSFVPGKGIVAFADGREGVLLIGESLNGWELVAVSPDNAQFKAGQKSYQVSADN